MPARILHSVYSRVIAGGGEWVVSNHRTAMSPLPSLSSALALAMLLSPAQVRAHEISYVVPVAARAPLPTPAPGIAVTAVDASVSIQDEFASTTLSVTISNRGTTQAEAVLLLPVPDGSVLRSFTYEGGSKGIEARILPRDEARGLYDAIVAGSKDPALLEFANTGAVRSSVFPVPAGSTQRVVLSWEQILPEDSGRLDYLLPRTEALDHQVPFSLTVNVRSTVRVAAIHSPSHEIVTERSDSATIVKLSPSATRQPGSFRLNVQRQTGELSAALTAYPDSVSGGGYFLLSVAPPPPRADAPPLRREITLVIDKSGSMAGAKMDQVRAAALQILEGIRDGEAFNLVAYNESVEAFSAAPVIRDSGQAAAARRFLEGIHVSGGTNIHDSLLFALHQPPTPGCLPVVIFLTDGLPTVGNTSSRAIREAAKAGNPHQRRLFTVGVGVDVNSPLLSALARGARGTPTVVLPDEDVELKVSALGRRLVGPLLADCRLVPDTGRVQDMLPVPADLFSGERIVALGRYSGRDPLSFTLTGRDAGGDREFRFTFSPDRASPANNHVPRLWAAGKIATLTESIRDLSDGSPVPRNDPRFRELVDEIVRLSREFGILSEYTAFFADDRAPLAAGAEAVRHVESELRARALSASSGAGAVNQERNIEEWRNGRLNPRNSYLKEDLTSAEITTVQQVGDRACFRRGNRWIDSRLAMSADDPPDEVAPVGSARFGEVVDHLAASGRLACLALPGDLLIEVNGRRVLITRGI